MIDMKKILLFILLCGMVSACAVSEEAKREKAISKALLAREVRNGIENRHFTIDVKTCHPMRSRPINLSTLYSLAVKGDTIISYLPYFGRAYSVPYGGGKALNFQGRISAYEAGEVKNGEYLINIGVSNDEDDYVYRIQMFDNGRADIEVRSRNRDRIYFTGDLDPYAK